MANNIQTAVRYFNNDTELAKIYETNSYTADWVKPTVAIGAQTVKYRKETFGSTVLGDFNRETGYTKIDINVTWEERKMTQDKGDSLVLDRMDGEEAQGLNIVESGKNYQRKIQIPSVDTYRFAAVVGTEGIEEKTGSLTKDNIEDELDAALDYLYNINARNGVTLKISSTAYRLLAKKAKESGSLSLGAWDGNLSAQVELYGDIVKAKVQVVPSDILGTGVNFIVAPTAAIAAMVKYQENEYFDKIPGFGGRRSQLDMGIYHDCWVEPGAEKAVYVHKAA